MTLTATTSFAQARRSANSATEKTQSFLPPAASLLQAVLRLLAAARFPLAAQHLLAVALHPPAAMQFLAAVKFPLVAKPRPAPASNNSVKSVKLSVPQRTYSIPSMTFAKQQNNSNTVIEGIIFAPLHHCTIAPFGKWMNEFYTLLYYMSEKSIIFAGKINTYKDIKV